MENKIILEKFNSGNYIKAKSEYKYFMPNEINKQWIWSSPIINNLLEKSSSKLGELNALIKFCPDIDLFSFMYIFQESLASNKIEGIQVNIDECLMPEEIKIDNKEDIKEFYNYIEALKFGIESLDKLPIASRLLKDIHRILLNSVRGKDKKPGEYRISQNWIGGKNIATAKFITPHQDYVNDLMNDLEKFINNDKLNIPELVRIAIIHYQFETIHPFLDGNGRIGRLLIILYLINKGILEKPVLYISSYFEENRELYYNNLTRVREKHDMLNWIKYFLRGIEENAVKSIDKLKRIINLKDNIQKEITDKFGGRSGNAINLLNYLFENPIISVENASKKLGLSYNATNNLISSFKECNYLKEITGWSRNRLFIFKQYLNIFYD